MRILILTLTAGLLCSYLLKAQTARQPAQPLPDQHQKEGTEFIRVQRDDDATRLQTSITTYQKGTTSVDLIGAVHVADKTYFHALNKAFHDYQVVLFEMVGGEMLGQGRPLPAVEGNGQGALGFLGTAYEKMQQVLALAGQKDEIDYSAENLLHADLTIAEFQALQKERKESILSFAMKQAFSSPQTNQPSSFSFMMALLSRNPNKLKLQLVDTLGQGDNNIGQLAGDNVIITDRNQKCLQVMDQQIAAGKTNLAIFYGAAHFPDMEKRLLERGFSKSKEKWVDAWTIPNAKK